MDLYDTKHHSGSNVFRSRPTSFHQQECLDVSEGESAL